MAKRWIGPRWKPFEPPLEEERELSKGDPFHYGKKKLNKLSEEEIQEFHKNRAKDSHKFGFNPVAPGISFGDTLANNKKNWKVVNVPQPKMVFLGKIGWRKLESNAPQPKINKPVEKMPEIESLRLDSDIQKAEEKVSRKLKALERAKIDLAELKAKRPNS